MQKQVEALQKGTGTNLKEVALPKIPGSEGVEMKAPVPDLYMMQSEVGSLIREQSRILEEAKALLANHETTSPDDLARRLDDLRQANQSLRERASELQDRINTSKSLTKSPVELPRDQLLSSDQIEKEIAEAKQRLGEIENGRFRSMSEDAAFAEQLEGSFRSEIDSIYGKRGLLGFRKIEGVNTQEWKEMARLPASKVLEYYKDPSQAGSWTDLPRDTISKLADSEKHKALITQLNRLKKQAADITENRVDFKPFDNGESVESFIKRLGAFLMRQGK